VNQPDKMYQSKQGAPYRQGQARYGNAVYTYEPGFQDGGYKEGAIDEGPGHVTFEFYTPFIIGATPDVDGPWGIYESGCRNGLILHGKAECGVSISVDQGRTWTDPVPFGDGLDLTDAVKGRRQYFLKFSASPEKLRGSGLQIFTTCQLNPATLPQLKSGGTAVTFADSQRAVISAGPNIEQARTHLIGGDFKTPQVTLQLNSPRGEPALGLYAAAHVASGNPPDENVRYQIEYSTDAGKSWQPVVKDWKVPRMGEEPPDFWSQSLCYGSAKLPEIKGPIQIRFSNSGRKPILRAEAHLIYRTASADPTRITCAWNDKEGLHTASKVLPSTAGKTATWQIATGENVETRWVELAPVATR
jgi:hypothetical protein